MATILGKSLSVSSVVIALFSITITTTETDNEWQCTNIVIEKDRSRLRTISRFCNQGGRGVVGTRFTVSPQKVTA